MGLMLSASTTITIEEAKRNQLGFLIGNLLLIACYVYGLIFYRTWSSLIYLLVAGIVSLILHRIVLDNFGGIFSRLLFIWILPIAGCIYFVIKTV